MSSADYYTPGTYTRDTSARAERIQADLDNIAAGFGLLPGLAMLKRQVQEAVVAGGTADALTITTTYGVTAYASYQRITFVASAANTGAATINVNTLGAKALVRHNGDALTAGDLATGRIYEAIYDGTSFQIIGTISGDITAAAASAAAAAVSASAASTSAGSASSSATAAAASATEAAQKVIATSTTSLALSTGAVSPTIQAGKGYTTGTRLRFASDADPTDNWMEGEVTSYSGTTLNITMDLVSSTASGGPYIDWSIGIAGERGASGILTLDEQEFNASGTWTKPAGAIICYVEVVGPGGGGASGSSGATPRPGGGGGGGSGRRDYFDAADLGGTETVTIGAGGTGGAGVLNNLTGNAGTDGGTTSFGSHSSAGGGKGAPAPTGANYPAGGNGGSIWGTGSPTGYAGGAGTPANTESAGTPGANGGGGGGGSGNAGGGSIYGAGGGGSAEFTSGGGAGGKRGAVSAGGGAAASGSGVTGGTGDDFQGGGAGWSVGTGTTGHTAGGQGGKGGGGGGGGNCGAAATSAAGGNGGAGYVRVLTVCAG